jgi:predicted transposase/invertase (TIGR01784 family)
MDDFYEKKGEAVQRYVDLLTNSGFKAVFGDRANKDVVMSVMNSFLPPHRHVTDIEYTATEHQGQLLSNKEYRYDFMCKDADGVSFIVEMQCYPDTCWFQRCVSYASRAYDRQNQKGGSYDVPPVYLIGLMGVELTHSTSETWKDRYISEYTFMETVSHELQDETIIIIFAELARFCKTLEECCSDLDRMLYVIRNMGNLKNQPESLKHEIFTRIFRACEIAKFDEDKRIQYDQDMYDERRRIGELKTAEMIGLERGREEGREEAKLESAAKFKQLGVAVEIISQATGLPVETIEKL